jgi:hypothetical protein
MLLLLYEEQRQPSSFTVLVSVHSIRTRFPWNVTYRAAITDLNAHVAARAPVVRLPIARNFAPGHACINHTVMNRVVLF